MPILLPFRNYLWLAPAVLQIGVLGLMAGRKLYRRFPFFTLYNIESVLGVAVLFSMYLAHVSGRIWARTYFLDTALYTALRLAVLYEIYAHVFDNYAALKRLGKPIFRGALLLLLAIALVAATQTHQRGPDFAMYALHVLEQTASVLQVGLLLVLFLFSAYIGLSWRNYVFGMALGLGIYASVKLAAAALQASFVASGNQYINLVVMGSFHFAVLVWLFYLLAPEPVLNRAIGIPDHNLELWNKELQRLSRP
jgi:NADH:ubiquinone oxidoreductase subunit K